MPQQLRFIVAAEEARQRLDVFLAAQLGALSRMRIANLLAAGAGLVNQQARHAGYHLAAGDIVEITIDETAAPTGMLPEKIPLDVVYEDEEIIVINKPSGMLVHPTRSTKNGTLVNALAYHLNLHQMQSAEFGADTLQSKTLNQEETVSPSLPDHPQSAIRNPQSKIVRPGLVHRLDRATSGLMVIAKTQRALSILTRHFHHKRVFKRYLALVHGRIVEDEDVIIAPIGEAENRQPPRWVLPEGKYAETRFRVIERVKEATLVELEPVTGRTNQLRIHMAYLGHPIFGDEIYGSVADYVRLCLHAARLEFHHPSGGRWMQFNSLLPEGINEMLNSLHEEGNI